VHAHNPFTGSIERLIVIQGDITDKTAVRRAIEGSDVVVSALGSWHTKQKNILNSAMQTIIPAMQAIGMTRLITLTGSGAKWSADEFDLFDRLGRRMLMLFAPAILRDSEAHLQQLDESTLDWTCLRSPVMTKGKGAHYVLRHTLNTPFSTIPRAAVVRCMLDQALADTEIRQAPVIYRR
jgi:putative NADH-flavin reductase